ncbi:MAG: cobalt transporter CbiM [Desulfovibrionaceae bacterium]|nr:cobalt transporter CbiM [Desulfovibrionaceae bacterium]
MHISDGALSAPVLLGGGILAAAGVGWGLKKLPWENMMPVAVISSAFFVASLIHVQVGPSSAHLMLNGLMGVMLGWASIPAIAVALFLQSLLLQYGGLSSLGVNICTVGIPALLAGMLFRRSLVHGSGRATLAAFCCGAAAIALTALLVAVALALSGEEFYAAAMSVLLAHVPVMFIEGFLTALVYGMIRKLAPAMLVQV